MAKKKSSKSTKNKKKKISKKNQHKSGFFRLCFKWLFVLAIWGFLSIVGLFAWYGKDLQRIAQGVNVNNVREVVVYANDGKTQLAAYGHVRGPNVRVEDLPQHIPNAFIAIEDRRFYRHFGIDLIGLTRAIVRNIAAGRIVQGGSTITQQLAKNLFFTPERTIKRKIQEAMLAIWIENTYSKEEILSAYLNQVYFGAGAYGLHSAAQIYFDKEPEDLGLKEAALLAGLMQAPSRLAPTHNPEGAIKRMRVVLNAMQEEGYVTADMIIDAKNVNIKKDGQIAGMTFATRTKDSYYFTDWIYKQVNLFASDIPENLRVTTTLSPNLQKKIADIARAELNKLYPEDGDKKHPEVAAVMLNEHGAIRAMVGGYDYEQSQFNRATDAMRQAGSSFKPFVYLAAIEQGWRPEDEISNLQIEEGEYRPSNYDDYYSELVTLSEALANSYNVSSVHMIDRVGLGRVIDLAERVGIDAEVRHELSTALGTVDIALLDLTGAYATLGQDGRLITPYGIQKIETEEGELLYSYKSTKQPRVVAAEHADAITTMMQDVVEFGTGRRAQTGFPVAGKTGTTQDYRDALFMGFSSTYTMGVWIGYDDNSSMGKGAYGGLIPATIWRKSMKEAHRFVPAKDIANHYSKNHEDGPKSFINNLFSRGQSGGISRWNNNSSEERYNFNN